MATTGFWAVKGRLKDVIDYAKNSDKTIGAGYMDKELYDTLQYASDGKKTDEKLFVSGINCTASRAFERMTATKKRFGKTGGNVAYHGYQSFAKGEVTPQDAHRIGLETARRMWGGSFEIVVTTHLNTDNLHNHFVVNSVSFKTGRKFENHISDHFKLREISDAVCMEYGKSVLKNAPFYDGDKKEYWLKQSGKLSHRELLRADVDAAIAQSTSFQAFEFRLKQMGYEIHRGEGYAHYSVRAQGWKRALRIERLGKDYTPESIKQRLKDNQLTVGILPFHKPEYAPLLTLEARLRRMERKDGIQILFELIIELCRLVSGRNISDKTPRPLSPEMRQEVVRLDRTLKEYALLCENRIDTPQELASFICVRRERITALEQERKRIYYRNRHRKSEELKSEAREISAQIKPLRTELSLAEAVLRKLPRYEELIETERQAEAAVFAKQQRKRGYER